MPEFKYICVNNDHGWGKGETIEAARNRSLVEGRKATRVRIWEITDGKGNDAYVDGMGAVFWVKPDTVKEFTRKNANARKWTEVPYDPDA